MLLRHHEKVDNENKHCMTSFPKLACDATGMAVNEAFEYCSMGNTLQEGESSTNQTRLYYKPIYAVLFYINKKEHLSSGSWLTKSIIEEESKNTGKVIRGRLLP